MAKDVPLGPLDARWPEVKSLIERIRDARIEGEHRASIVPTVAGCSFQLAGAIGSVVGTSGTLPLSVVSNDMDLTRSLVQFDINGFCEPEVAHALAAHGYFELASAKGPDFPLTSIFGIGITGAIASREPEAGKRGGHRVYISLKRSDRTVSFGLKFRHGSELGVSDQDGLRRYQSQLSDVTALNLVAGSLGVDMMPLPRNEFIESVSGEGWLPKDWLPKPEEFRYARAADLNSMGVLISPAGGFTLIDAVEPLKAGLLEPGKHVLIPTSADPFTPGHDAMAREIKKLRVAGRGNLIPVFVLNKTNAEKRKTTDQVVLDRARACFGRWPVLVLWQEDMRFFVEMARRLKLDIAVGGDTPPRIFDPKYCENWGGPLAVYTVLKAQGVKFYVFPREDKFGRLQDCRSIPTYAQDDELFVPVPHFLNRWSSTKARAAV